MTDATYMLARGDALRLPLPDRSVSMVFGSPPYVDARLYLEDGKDLGIARGCEAWVAWMLAVTAEALRVSRGAVVWVAAGVTRDRTYWPACEGLMWEWWKRGGSAYRPCYWHRNGIPGSGGSDWFRADVEYCMAFKHPGPLPWSDNTAMGHPPKYGPGGEMSYRVKDGERRNQWGGHENKRTSQRRPDGTFQEGSRPSHVIGGGARDQWGGTVTSTGSLRASGKRRGRTVTIPRPGMHPNDQEYAPPVLANPGNLIDTGAAGGGNSGHKLCHENEAPFAEDLAEFFVRSLCPPGGTVLDPFSGSGTTVAVAAKHDRRGIGLDLRRSQCELGARRIPAGLRPVSRLDGAKPLVPLPGQQNLFGTGA